MPGRPKLRKMSRQIVEQGGDSVIMDRIANGETMQSIADDYGVSRYMIYQWIHAGGEEREKGWEIAKKLSAHSLVEDGLNILDELADKNRALPPETSEVTLARARAEYRKWLAEVRGRDEYGRQDGGVNINVNLGNLHLDALRHRGRMPVPEAEAQIEEAEVLAVEGEVS